MMSKRVAVHFDDEIFLVGDKYYYRGTPLGLKRRVECPIGLRRGALQKDVLKAKKEILETLSRGGINVGKNSVESIGRLYVNARTEEAENPEHLSPRTLSETKHIIENHIIPYFGSRRIEEIDQAVFDDYCNLKKRKQLNLVNHRKVMNHFLKWCVRKKYLRYRMELEIPNSAKKKRRQREVLTDDEVKKLISAADGKILLYVSMYLLMGMRNMEICKLRWDEVNFSDKAIFINPLNNRRRKMRVIPINPFVFKLLKKRKDEISSEWVFPSKTSTSKVPHMSPGGGIRKSWGKLLKNVRLTKHITPHDLRATFETYMHLNPAFTDTQREKMAGARIDVQKDIYVKMQVEQLRGLENSVNVSGLDKIFTEKTATKSGGNTGGRKPKNKA